MRIFSTANCCTGSPTRCAGYDRDNRFFHEDFEDLRQALAI